MAWKDGCRVGLRQRATDKLLALTPPPARGKCQIQDETELAKAAEAILKAHDVKGLLAYTCERQEKRQTRYIGRGRSNAERPKHEIVTVRYQITTVIRQQEEAIAALPSRPSAENARLASLRHRRPR